MKWRMFRDCIPAILKSSSFEIIIVHSLSIGYNKTVYRLVFHMDDINNLH